MNTHLLFIGGEDHHLRLPFFRAMRANGFRVSIAASGRPEPFVEEGFDYHSIRFSRFIDPVSDWRAIAQLRGLLAYVNADLAHCFDTKLTLLTPFAAGRNCRTRIVRTINGRGWIYSSHSPTARALQAIYPSLHKLVAPFVSATVFEHTEDQAFFVNGNLLRNGRSIVIKGAGIDCDPFLQAASVGPTSEQLRGQLGLEDAEVIATVTRVTREKGIPVLLEAARRVHQERRNARFLIIGPRDSEGPFRIRDEELAVHADYVIATGARTDVPALLKMADLFVFPSEYAEGVPRAVLEAALMALPIVSTSLPGCRSIIRHEWNGLLTETGSPQSIANNILRFLNNRKEAALMGSRGPEIVRREFSLDEVVMRHAALYESVLTSPIKSKATARQGVSSEIQADL